jgi:hypothetical protein
MQHAASGRTPELRRRPAMTIPAPAARLFTVDDANRTLPLVRMIVQDVVGLYGDLKRRRERLVSLRSRQGGKARGSADPYEAEVIQMEAELEADVERLDEFLEELRRIGAELRDPETGLVEFPSQLEGREVCLSWRLGEPAVNFWYEADAGFAERQPLPSANPAAGRFPPETRRN